MDDYYEILGVSRDASDNDVKKAYRRLAMKWHPDKNRNNLDEATAQFKRISEAYEVLADSDKRRAYNRGNEGPGSSEFPHHADFAQFHHNFTFNHAQKIFEDFFGGSSMHHSFSHPGHSQHHARHMGRTHTTGDSLHDNLLHSHMHHAQAMHQASFGGFGGDMFAGFHGFGGAGGSGPFSTVTTTTHGGVGGGGGGRSVVIEGGGGRSVGQSVSTSTSVINGKRVTRKETVTTNSDGTVTRQVVEETDDGYGGKQMRQLEGP